MADGIFAEDGEGEVIDVGAQPGEPSQAGPSQAGPSQASPGLQPVLRAEWDGQGRCWVALFQGQKQLEKWRPPTKEEWDELRKRGVLTRPSPVAPPVGQVAPQASSQSMMDVVKNNAVPFALGAGSLFLILKYSPQLFGGLMPTLKPAPAPAPAPADEDDLDDSDDSDEI